MSPDPTGHGVSEVLAREENHPWRSVEHCRFCRFGERLSFPASQCRLESVVRGRCAIETALKGDHLIFTVAQRENVEEPAPEQLYTMGVVGRIGQVQRGLGGVQLLLQGEVRATALHYHSEDGSLTVDAMPIDEMKPIDENDAAFAALYKETRERARELGERKGLPEEMLHQILDSVTDPGRFADLVAGYVELPVNEKQALLETLGVEERLRRVLIHVQRQIGMLEAQAEIKSQVQEELGERSAKCSSASR